jgi:hypothetical protein
MCLPRIDCESGAANPQSNVVDDDSVRVHSYETERASWTEQGSAQVAVRAVSERVNTGRLVSRTDMGLTVRYGSPATVHPIRSTALSSPNGVQTRVSTLRGRNGSLHREPASPKAPRLWRSGRPASTTRETSRLALRHHGTELLGGMLGFLAPNPLGDLPIAAPFGRRRGVEMPLQTTCFVSLFLIA